MNVHRPMAKTVIGHGAIDVLSTEEEKEKNRQERRLKDLNGVDSDMIKEIAMNNIQQQSSQKYQM